MKDIAQLWALVQAKDEWAFEQVYDRYFSRVFRLAQSVLKDEGLSRDVVQEVFVYLWTNSEKVEAPTLENYMFTITRHKALNILRDAATHHTILVKIFAQLTRKERVLIPDEISPEFYEKALHTLSEQQRMAFTLIRLQGYSQEEAAEKMNISRNTIKTHLARAVLLLQKYYQENEACKFKS